MLELSVIGPIIVIGHVPDLDEENEMTELRKRMNDAMVLRGLAERTKESYLACVTGLAKYYWLSPDTLDAEAIQAYLLHLITEKKLASDNLISRILRRTELQDQAEVGAWEESVGRVQLVTEFADGAVRHAIGHVVETYGQGAGLWGSGSKSASAV